MMRHMDQTARADQLRILLVDDDAGNSDDLATLLEASGHAVYKAVDQREHLFSRNNTESTLR